MQDLIQMLKEQKISVSVSSADSRCHVDEIFGPIRLMFNVHYRPINEVSIDETRDNPSHYECDFELTGIDDVEVYCFGELEDLSEDEIKEITATLYNVVAFT